MPAPQISGGPDGLVERGHVDHAQDRIIIVQAGKHGPVERDALDKGDGAVYRVDDPLVPAGAWLVFELFAQDRVVRVTLADEFTQEGFALAVSDGDGRAVGFDSSLLWIEFPKVLQCDFAGTLGGFDGKIESLFKLALHARAPSF